DHLFEWNKADIETKILSHFDGHVLADRLVKRRKYAAFDEQLNNVARGDAKSLCKFPDGGPFCKSNGPEVFAIDRTHLLHHAFFDRRLTRYVDLFFGKLGGLVVSTFTPARTSRPAAIIRGRSVGHLGRGRFARSSSELLTRPVSGSLAQASCL